MAALMDIAPIDRTALVDAVRSGIDQFIDPKSIQYDPFKLRPIEKMSFLASEGLVFIITGEDGTKLGDDDLRQVAANEGALSGMLFFDLEEMWQGFHPDEKSDAWKICDTIAAAYCNFFTEATQ